MLQNIQYLYQKKESCICISGEKLYCDLCVSELIDNWCQRYGYTMEGSRNAISSLLKIRQKVPVCIHPFKQIYLFPTLSPRLKSCVWINPKQILKVVKRGFGSQIIFKDHSVLDLNQDVRSLRRQLRRCEEAEARILSQLREELSIDSLTSYRIIREK